MPSGTAATSGWWTPAGWLDGGTADLIVVAARTSGDAGDRKGITLFLVDGKEGVQPIDQAIAERLRRTRIPVLLAVNKLDDLERSQAVYEFFELGLGEPVGLSAAIGKSSGDLLDAMVALRPMIRQKTRRRSTSP